MLTELLYVSMFFRKKLVFNNEVLLVFKYDRDVHALKWAGVGFEPTNPYRTAALGG